MGDEDGERDGAEVEIEQLAAAPVGDQYRGGQYDAVRLAAALSAL